MDLRELSSALPKPWLNINAHTVNADEVTAASFASDDLVILKQAGVANPAVDKVAIYADLNGDLRTNDSAGNVNIILSETLPGVDGKFPVYAPGGVKLVDSTYGPVDFAQLSGATFTGAVAASSLTSAGVPVNSWRASKDSDWGVRGGNALEFDLISGTMVGSLVVNPFAQGGFTHHTKFVALQSSGAATTLTIRYKVNGTTVLTTTIPALVTVNVYTEYEFTLQRGDFDRVYVASKILQDGRTPIMYADLADAVWLNAGANTITITGQYSDNNGNYIPRVFEMWSSSLSF